jgi:hypothetical protein
LSGEKVQTRKKLFSAQAEKVGTWEQSKSSSAQAEKVGTKQKPLCLGGKGENN